MELTQPEQTNCITSLVLCGGEARRMQRRDKPLELLNGKPLVSHVLLSLPPGPVLISANRTLARYRELGWPVIEDDPAIEAAGGPLAGIAAAASRCKSQWLYVVAGDTPRLPQDLATKLLERCISQCVPVACVQTDQLQPLPVLLNKDVLKDLPDYLAAGERSVKGWLSTLDHAILDQSERRECFININTLEELAAVNRDR